MSAHDLLEVAELLSEYYGRQEYSDKLSSDAEDSSWMRLVKVVLGTPDSQTQKTRIISAMQRSPLGSPHETAEASVDELVASASELRCTKPKAAMLKSLASWWIERFNDEAEPAWNAGLAQYRSELSRIRGVGLELVDRILLSVGGLPVYPLSRSSIRLACRHGWLGLEAEYEEWQSLFVEGLSHNDVDLYAFSSWVRNLGTDFCGPQPQCEECPLKPLLPIGGPYEPGES